MAHDPTLYAGTAPYYRRGRPPYSADLLAVLTAELGLDGTGRLLDVGCGPGILTVQLAAVFDEVVGLDPDPGMLAEANSHAAVAGIDGIVWIEARAEEIGSLDLPPMRLVTFGQSFHWTERDLVADAVYDLLQPGGSVAMITHDVDARPAPTDGPAPPIPHEALHDVVHRFLGPRHRAGQGLRPVDPEPYEVSLARSPFPPRQVLYAPGQPDVVRSADDVVANLLSTSFAAPHLFGPDLDAFVAAVHDVLRAASPSGRFWDWPGDTWVLVATKPG